MQSQFDCQVKFHKRSVVKFVSRIIQ